MPKIYGTYHNQKMKNYFEYGKTKIINQDRIVYAMQKNGYILETNLYLKILPKLDNGIQVIGFMSTRHQNKEEKVNDVELEGIAGNYHYILFSKENIISFNRS